MKKRIHLDQRLFLTYHHEMGKKDSRHGFLKKMIYTYLAILIVPLVFLNIFVFRLVINHAKELNYKYTEESLDRIRYNLEDEIERLGQIAIHVGESLLIRSSVLERDFNKILEAQNLLKSYTVANQFISDIIYYPHDGQTFYGSNSVYSLNTYTTYFLAIPEISQYDVFKKINSVKIPQLMKWTETKEGERFLYFHYIIPLEKNTDRDSCLIFLISYSKMSRLLGIDKTPPSAPLFLTDNHGRILFDYIPPGKHEAKDLFLNEITAHSGKKEKGGYTRVSMKLNDPPWTLTAMVENSSLLPSIKGAFALAGLISLAILLLEVIIFGLALKFTYKPLKNLAKTLAPEETVDDVLISLQTGVHRLQSTRESALRKLQREDFIGTLLHLRPDDDSDQLLQNKAVAIGFSREISPMAAIIIDLGEQVLPGDSDLIDAYYETLTEMVPLPIIGWYEPVTGRIFCVVQTEKTSRSDLQMLLEDSCEQLFEEFAIEGTVFLGEFKNDYLHLKNSINEAMITSTKLSQEEKQNLSYYENELSRLFGLLKEGDRERALSLIIDLYKKSPSMVLTDYLTFRFFDLIARSLPKQHQESWRKLKHPSLKTVEDENKKSHILALAEEYFEILAQTGTQSAFKISILEDIDRYIKENYLKADFSVSQTAEYFNMSLSGISLLYKKHRGYGISAYVGNARIERAKELLRSGLSVNEVVREVGYHDTTSFIKKFKKISGQTPGEYLSGIKK